MRHLFQFEQTFDDLFCDRIGRARVHPATFPPEFKQLVPLGTINGRQARAGVDVAVSGCDGLLARPKRNATIETFSGQGECQVVSRAIRAFSLAKSV
jgi:hypothetical protein